MLGAAIARLKPRAIAGNLLFCPLEGVPLLVFIFIFLFGCDSPERGIFCFYCLLCLLRGVPEDLAEEIGEGEKGWKLRVKLRVNRGQARVKSQKVLPHSRFVVSFDARERSFPEILLGSCFLAGVPEGLVEGIGEGSSLSFARPGGRKGVMVAQERGWRGADSFWKHCLIQPFSRNKQDYSSRAIKPGANNRR